MTPNSEEKSSVADSIPSALTPDEWKDWHSEYGTFFADRDIEQNRHRMAAQCLYQQPFGFTQEDVDALSVLLDQAERFGANHPRSGDVDSRWWGQLPIGRSAVEKIRSLLPPNKP